MHTSEMKKKSASSPVIYSFILLSISIITLIFSTDLTAQGNLMVFPRRVVFEGLKRSQEINIANTGVDTARYVISFVNYRMKENGEFEEITQPDSGQNFADKYIRFFPRSVVLAPNEAQIVRVQVIRNNQISPGEYRSHLYFRAVPAEKPLGEKDLKDTTSISIKLLPIFGMTIPVIVRVGESTARVNIFDISFKMVNDTLPAISLAFKRTGNISVYGDIAFYHISPLGKITRVNFVQGMAIYTPNLVRRFKVNLDRTLGVDYRKGKLHIVYSSQSAAKPEKFAEAELLLH
jgi:hypothetical protein